MFVFVSNVCTMHAGAYHACIAHDKKSGMKRWGIQIPSKFCPIRGTVPRTSRRQSARYIATAVTLTAAQTTYTRNIQRQQNPVCLISHGSSSCARRAHLPRFAYIQRRGRNKCLGRRRQTLSPLLDIYCGGYLGLRAIRVKIGVSLCS